MEISSKQSAKKYRVFARNGKYRTLDPGWKSVGGYRAVTGTWRTRICQPQGHGQSSLLDC